MAFSTLCSPVERQVGAFEERRAPAARRDLDHRPTVEEAAVLDGASEREEPAPRRHRRRRHVGIVGVEHRDVARLLAREDPALWRRRRRARSR